MSEGTSQESTTHYYYKEEQSWWGGRGDSHYTSDLAKLSSVVSDLENDEGYSGKASHWSEPTKKETFAVGDGYYINDQNTISDNLTLLAQNVVTEDSYGNHTIDGSDEHGFAGFYEDYDHRWTRTRGAKQIYQYSVKADYPISVGIIGESNRTALKFRPIILN